MTVAEMIKEYGITLYGDANIQLHKTKKINNEVIAMIKENKAKIIAHLKAEKEAAKRAKEERIAKINAIEGLNELRKAMIMEEEYNYSFHRMMNDEYNDGAVPRRSPKLQ